MEIRLRREELFPPYSSKLEPNSDDTATHPRLTEEGWLDARLAVISRERGRRVPGRREETLDSRGEPSSSGWREVRAARRTALSEAYTLATFLGMAGG